MQNNAVAPDNVSFPYTHQADPVWVKAAQDSGFTSNTISREDCIKVREKTGQRLPRWLMKDPTRRVARGLYACPELTFGIKQTKSGANS